MRRSVSGAVFVALTACGTLPPQGMRLAGTEWRVSAINGRATPPGPVAYSMSFEAARLGARFGCNSIGGSYRLTGSTLTTDALVMTEMACSEPAASFESQGAAILMQPMAIGPGGARMTLSNRAGVIELVRGN